MVLDFLDMAKMKWNDDMNVCNEFYIFGYSFVNLEQKYKERGYLQIIYLCFCQSWRDWVCQVALEHLKYFGYHKCSYLKNEQKIKYHIQSHRQCSVITSSTYNFRKKSFTPSHPFIYLAFSVNQPLHASFTESFTSQKLM